MPSPTITTNTIDKKVYFLAAGVIIIVLAVIFYPRIIKSPADNTAQPVAKQTISEEEKLKKTWQEAVREVNNAVAQPVALISGQDHFIGDINAPVQFIIYDNFTNPFSAELATSVESVKKDYGDRVVIAWRHYFEADDNAAMIGANLAECAGEQNKFFEMRDKLTAVSFSIMPAKEVLEKMADDLQLGKKDFLECVSKNKFVERITGDLIGARAAWVTGAPTFFVNGQNYVGAYPYEDFTRSDGSQEKGLKNIIADALAMNGGEE